MAFSVQDFQDLVRLLEQRPEWRIELRRLVLTDDLLGLPAVVRELAGQVHTLALTVAELAEAQRRTQDELRALAKAQQRTEGEVRVLAEAHQRLEIEVRRQGRVQDTMRDQLGQLRGSDLERRYRERAGACFDDLVLRATPLSHQQLANLLDAAGRLTRAERRDLLETDLVIRGRRREDGGEVHLVVEISVGIGLDDVARAARRASLLNRVRPAQAVVAGEWATLEAANLAEAGGVWRVLDGRTLPPNA